MKRNHTYIMSILLSLWTSVGWTQSIITNKSFTLNSGSDIFENVSYIASDNIKLIKDFRYFATPDESFNAKIDPGLLFLNTDKTYAKPDGTFTFDPTQGAIVGTIPGQLSVSAGGGGTYVIPINCPQGINGMSPNISLVYNSQDGDGAYGVGWNLSGLSTIRKTIKNIHTDAAITSLDDNTTDAYSLDGQRMVVKNFVSHYPSYNFPLTTNDDLATIIEENTPGSTYQLEYDDYSKIESYGVAGYLLSNGIDNYNLIYKGPRTFKVFTKEGYIKEYVVSFYQYTIPQNQPLCWFLSKVTDPNGNYITYNYQTDEGQTVIKSIDYTGNSDIDPFESVVFSYDTIAASYSYIGSAKVAKKFLLNNIQIKYNNTLLSKYLFTYINRNNKYYINDVRLVGQSNVKLNPTKFEWGEDNTLIAVKKQDMSTPYLPQNAIMDNKNGHWLSTDTNGDGLTDLIEIYPASTIQNGIYQCKNYLQVYKAVITGGQVSYVADAYYVLDDNFSYDEMTSLNPNIRFADLYGKNKDEIILPKIIQNGGTSTITFNVSGGETISQTLVGGGSDLPVCSMGDINNDGKEEIIFIEKTNIYNSGNYIYPGKIGYNIDGQWVWESKQFQINSLPKSIFLSDLNADGLIDLSVLTDNGLYAFKNEGGGKQTDGVTHIIFSGGSSVSTDIKSTCPIVKQGDFNGDGLPDFIVKNQSSDAWLLALNNGSWDFAETNLGSLSIPGDELVPNDKTDLDCIVTDFNHDGKSDIIITEVRYDYSSTLVPDEDDILTHYVFDNTKVNWYRSDGNGFTSIKNSTNSTNKYKKYYSTKGDFDGDGRADVFTCGSDLYNGNDISEKWYFHGSFNNDFKANLLKSVTNGLGMKTDISYRPLTYATNSDNSTFYTKGSASVYPMADIQYPLYCVNKISTSNGMGGTWTTNLSYTEARSQLTGVGYMGFKTQTVTNDNSNTKIITTTDINPGNFLPEKITRDVKTLGNNPVSKSESFFSNSFTGNNYRSEQSKVINTDYLTGLSQTTEFQGFDDYGNPSTITSTQGNITQTQAISYIQKGSWCLNKPLGVTVTKTQGNDNYIRSVNYGYDDNGNLTSKVIDPGNTNQMTIQYSQFVHGQPTKIETTANSHSRIATLTVSPSGRFILSKTDVLGQTTFYEWDYARGLLNNETNRLGTTTYTYNGLGQLAETKYPDGMRSSSIVQWAVPNNTSGAKFYTCVQSSGSAPLTVWYDALGREFMKETTGLNDNTIRVFTEYNSDGRIYRVSEPTFNLYPDTWNTTYNHYDNYGRPDAITTPAGQTTVDYNGTITTVHSPNGTRQTVLNSTGKITTNTVNGKSVSYTYYPSGLAHTATPDGGQSIQMEYDLQGKRTKLIDPDAGTVISEYNGFGQLTGENQVINNSGNPIATTYNYDNSTGILQSLVLNGETTSYGYDTYKRLVTKEIAGKNKQTFSYDALDRITSIEELIGTRQFNKQVEYDAFGHIKKEIFPSGYYTQNNYDAYGNMTEVTDYAGRSIWKAVEANARGQLVKENKGAKQTVYGYDDKGQVTSIAADGIVNMAYTYYSNGNLQSRADNIIQQNEQFTYDALNRLTNWDVHLNGSTTVAKAGSVNYDPVSSNIISKSDLDATSTMNYSANGKPHALTSISGGVPGAYLPAVNLNVTYTNFKKVASISYGTKDYTITYGVDQQRRKSVLTQGTNTLTKYYLGDYEEEQNTVGNIRKIHYLSGGAMLIQNNGRDSLLYGYSDNQGSLIALTDESGNLIQKYAYDPWGARRNPSDWTQKDTRTSWLISRGYTGHEHLDAFGIINMNGRVYDPLTAQFFSPDPFVQSPDNWLNYNRYSYCFNNPLIYSDPSGYLIPQLNESYRKDRELSEGFDPNFVPTIYNQNYLLSLRNGGAGGGYTYLGGSYLNSNNEPVPFSEVYNNYILPNASYIESYSGSSAQSVVRNFQNGLTIYQVTFRGKTNYVANVGELGTATIGDNGGLTFSNFNGGMTSLSFWEGGNRSGYLAEAGGHVSENLGLIKLGADLNVAAEGGWNTTKTLKGFLKLGDWHYTRVGLTGFSKTLNVLGHVGTVLGAAATINSGLKVYNQFDKGGFSNIDAWDAADTVTGTLGTTATILLATTAWNPVVLGAVGIGVTVYGVVRLGMWICE